MSWDAVNLLLIPDFAGTIYAFRELLWEVYSSLFIAQELC